MASSIFSYSLFSTFKTPISGCMMSSTNNPSPCLMLPPTLAPISGRMMSSTTVSCLNNPSPCLMLPPTLEGFGGGIVYNFYDLAQNKVISFNNNKSPEKGTKIVGSSHGWLALFDELNSDLILTNPVTHRHVKLPSKPIRKVESEEGEGVSKVSISCDAEQDECQAMMIFDIGRLAFCRPGRSPTEWTHIGAFKWRSYKDLVYSSRRKLFFCITDSDALEGWNVASNRGYEKYQAWLHRAEELLEDEGLRCETFKYLVFVEQTDQLFLVTRHLVRRMAPDGSAVEGDDSCPYKTVSFDVHKIDWELEGGGRLSHVDGGGSLDGLAMFVGLNHSFAMSATEANGLKPNSIYFTDEKELTPLEWQVNSKYGGHDIGIFDYENKTISPCYYPCDIKSYKRILPPPIWFTPSHN